MVSEYLLRFSLSIVTAIVVSDTRQYKALLIHYASEFSVSSSHLSTTTIKTTQIYIPILNIDSFIHFTTVLQ